MRNFTLILLLAFLTSACSATTGKKMIQGYNLSKHIASITQAGMKEEASNCIKDIFDTSNRGSGC